MLTEANLSEIGFEKNGDLQESRSPFSGSNLRLKTHRYIYLMG